MIPSKMVLVVGLLLAIKASAGNDALAQIQPVPAGERVAHYLQSLLITASAILETQKPGDLINKPDVYRVGVTYNPDAKVIDVSVVGNDNNPDNARQKLELTRKLILSFNKKIQRNFGVVLGEDDLIMDYLDAKTSRIILKYKEGQFLLQPKGQSGPSDETDKPKDD